MVAVVNNYLKMFGLFGCFSKYPASLKRPMMQRKNLHADWWCGVSLCFDCWKNFHPEEKIEQKIPKCVIKIMNENFGSGKSGASSKSVLTFLLREAKLILRLTNKLL